MRLSIGLLFALTVLLTAGTSMSVWDGIYLPDQAKKGEVVYNEQCAMCHGTKLEGLNGPALIGAPFKENWNGLTADDMFEYIKTSMPRGQVGRLSREQTATMVAFLLSSNGFPVGKSELPVDAKALQSISFEAEKPGVESTKAR